MTLNGAFQFNFKNLFYSIAPPHNKKQKSVFISYIKNNSLLQKIMTMNANWRQKTQIQKDVKVYPWNENWVIENRKLDKTQKCQWKC